RRHAGDRAGTGSGGGTGQRRRDAEGDLLVGDTGRGLDLTAVTVAPTAAGVAPAGAQGEGGRSGDREDPDCVLPHRCCLSVCDDASAWVPPSSAGPAAAVDLVPGPSSRRRLRRRKARGRDVRPPGSTKRMTSRMIPEYIAALLGLTWPATKGTRT